VRKKVICKSSGEEPIRNVVLRRSRPRFHSRTTHEPKPLPAILGVTGGGGRGKPNRSGIDQLGGEETN